MFVQIAPHVRVFLTQIQIEFVNKYKNKAKTPKWYLIEKRVLL